MDTSQNSGTAATLNISERIRVFAELSGATGKLAGKFTEEERAAISRAVRSGDEELSKTACWLVIDGLHGYINKRINHFMVDGTPEDKEDCFQECACVIVRDLPGYDPEKGYTFMTYFGTRIDDVICQYRAHKYGVTKNAELKKPVVKRALYRLETRGISKPSLKEIAEDIKKYEGKDWSEKVVANTLAIIDNRVSYEACAEQNLDRRSLESNPEEMVLKEEEKKMLENAVNHLPPAQKEIFNIFADLLLNTADKKSIPAAKIYEAYQSRGGDVYSQNEIAVLFKGSMRTLRRIIQNDVNRKNRPKVNVSVYFEQKKEKNVEPLSKNIGLNNIDALFDKEDDT